MAADIDEFIRNQKIRMARDRNKLKSNNDDLARPVPVRHQDHVGAILREDEPHPTDYDMPGPTNEERKAAIDGRYGGSAMPGIGERGSADTRHAVTDRNREYNAFKAAEEAKFRNRFANRKPSSGPNQAPIVAPAAGMVPPQMPPPAVVAQQQQQQQDRQRQSGRYQAQIPQYPTPRQPPPPQQRAQRIPPPLPPQQRAPNADPPSQRFGSYEPSALGPGTARIEEEYNKKLESLEKTVAELRNQMTRQTERPQPPPEAPRQGWATPDYADMLAAKRRQEAQRRRLEDPELFGRLDAMKSEKERRLEELEFEMTSQKASLMTSRRSAPRRLPLDLDNSEDWLRAKGNPDVEKGLKKLGNQPSNPRQSGPGRQAGQTRRLTGPAPSKQQEGQLSLAVGSEERVSAKVRRQGAYREQLQQQMREQEEMKKRERAERLAPAKEAPQTRRGQAPSQILQASPNAAAQPILQTGLENIASLTVYKTPADDAYFYYASRDPLEAAGPENVAAGPSTGTVLQQSGSPPGVSPPRPKQGQPPSTAAANRARMQSTTLNVNVGDDKDAERQRKAAYAQELQRQMQEVAAAKERRKKEQEEYDRKKDEEIASYNLFQSRGGGGGEPIKLEGQVITDLRAHRRQGGVTPRAAGPAPAPPPPTAGASGDLRLQLGDSARPGAGDARGPPVSEPGSQRTPRQVNALGEATHARGGHGVFGQPKTDEEKEKTDRYKEELRQQMEENQRKKQEQKRLEKLQEEKEQRRAEEQMKRIQAEYKEEQRKKQEKIDATKRKNEEMWKEAEEKRIREAEERKAKTRNPTALANTQKELQQPPRSPPIPTVNRQRRMKSPQVGPAQPSPAPAPANHRSESQPDVLRQLERMKQELASERVRIEDALKAPPAPQPSRRYEEVPASAMGGRYSRNSDIDIFEMARHGRSGPVIVRSQRPYGDPPNQEVLREFRNLKLRDTDVGRNVRAEHPGTPLTSDQLEIQQNTYLRGQQELMHDIMHLPIEPVRYRSPRQPKPRQPVSQPRIQKTPERDLEIASTYSFDVEDLNQRNEERMRRLSRMNPDQISMQDQEEVLDRFMRQRTHITNEAERETEQERLRPPSVRNRQTSYGTPPRGTKQTSMPAPAVVNLDTPMGGLPNVNPHDGWDDESPAPGGPTPLDDSWLNPTRRR